MSREHYTAIADAIERGEPHRPLEIEMFELLGFKRSIDCRNVPKYVSDVDACIRILTDMGLDWRLQVFGGQAQVLIIAGDPTPFFGENIDASGPVADYARIFAVATVRALALHG
jgi:hypothetical protein